MGKGITEGNEKPLKELGVMISTCRKIRGLSQEELAKKAGISRSLISAIEAPRLAYNFTLDVLLNIANALDARAEELLKGDIPHGKVCISFTTDEEVGSGACHMDLERFGAPYAYTVDGGPEGEIQFENFNAASAEFAIHGVNVHPGEAKDIMVNSMKIAMELQSMLPEQEAPAADTPRNTEDYEGFFHLMEMNGSVEETTMGYLIREFDAEKYKARKALMQEITASLNKKYGEGTVELDLKDSYRNMREKIEPCMQLIDFAVQACKDADVEPDIAPIRGGTDGARLSFVGLPCPNLGTGGYGFHGAYEHITAEGMDKAVAIIRNIVIQFSK